MRDGCSVKRIKGSFDKTNDFRIIIGIVVSLSGEMHKPKRKEFYRQICKLAC